MKRPHGLSSAIRRPGGFACAVEVAHRDSVHVAVEPFDALDEIVGRLQGSQFTAANASGDVGGGAKREVGQDGCTS